MKYGRVREVYIPKKLDKRGCRFGFVKFLEVKDVDELCDNLQEVWLGSFKLFVNRPRFNRSEKVSVDSENAQVKGDDVGVLAPKSGKSFKTALLAPHAGNSRSRNQLLIKASANVSFLKELKGSFVATLSRENDTRRIQTTLYMEGFRSISVTHLGGRMVLLRSPMIGDVERLLKSKNECLEYYFSEIKPWSPGIVATQREVWIQVYGIPLHIWGENFFKQVGAKFGSFLDFDEPTASMRRLDVARLKISTDVWEVLDTVIKVEVEESSFNVWVVEEKNGRRHEVVLGDGVFDNGSRVVPSEVSGGMEDGYGGGAENSGEDDLSGNDCDGDTTMQVQHGEDTEAGKPNPTCKRVTKRRNETLLCNKSTSSVNSKKVINSFVSTHVSCKVSKATGVVAPSLECDDDRCLHSGSGPHVESANDGDLMYMLGDSLGLGDPKPDPILSDPCVVGLNPSRPTRFGPFAADGESRLSFISEPEEVLLSNRTKAPGRGFRNRRSNPTSKPHPLGVPRCVQFLEVVQAGNSKLHRRRIKSGVVVRDVCTEVDANSSPAPVHSVVREVEEQVLNPIAAATPSTVETPIVTPPSGIVLISNSDNSMVPDTPLSEPADDRIKLLEAAKLLATQKQVGFTFEVDDGVTINELIQHEDCDRAKKVDWEQKIGDQ
jgi:hypothetical protein